MLFTLINEKVKALSTKEKLGFVSMSNNLVAREEPSMDKNIFAN